MKLKCGYLIVGAGLAAMLGGLCIKESCKKCGSALFGFGLAHILLGSFDLMKCDGCVLPEKISIPGSSVEIDMK